MGGSASKQDIMARLEELDKQELDLNLKLKDMQVELNGMVPKEEQIKVNQNLTANSKIIRDYTAAPPTGQMKAKSTTTSKKSAASSGKKGKGKAKSQKGKDNKKKKK